MTKIWLLVVLGVFAVFEASAQTDAPIAQHESLTVYISDNDAMVEHILRESEQQILTPISGDMSDIAITDESQNHIPYQIMDGNFIIDSSDTSVSVQYNLDDILYRENNMWVWNFLYLHTVQFVFLHSESLDTLYANDQPVYLNDQDGIKCHGCQIKLEYTLDEPTTLYDVQWEEHKFTVALRSHDNIETIRLDPSTISIDFEVEHGNHPVAIMLPQDMLGGPYQAYLNDEGLRFREYTINDTHSWLYARPTESGIVTIIGTTVIPEFSGAILVMATALALVWFIRRSHHTSRNRTHQTENRTKNTLWWYN